MKLGVEVKNGELSLYLEFEVVGVVDYQPTLSTTQAKTTPNANFANFGPMKFGIAFRNRK